MKEKKKKRSTRIISPRDIFPINESLDVGGGIITDFVSQTFKELKKNCRKMVNLSRLLQNDIFTLHPAHFLVSFPNKLSPKEDVCRYNFFFRNHDRQNFNIDSSGHGPIKPWEGCFEVRIGRG